MLAAGQGINHLFTPKSFLFFCHFGRPNRHLMHPSIPLMLALILWVINILLLLSLSSLCDLILIMYDTASVWNMSMCLAPILLRTCNWVLGYFQNTSPAHRSYQEFDKGEGEDIAFWDRRIFIWIVICAYSVVTGLCIVIFFILLMSNSYWEKTLPFTTIANFVLTNLSNVCLVRGINVICIS